VKAEESTKVELGRLEELDLSYVDLRPLAVCAHCNAIVCTYVLERVDALGGLLDLAADDLGDQLLGELGKSA
jgi:hypothetical protein